MAKVGSGEYEFEVAEDWARLPEGRTFTEVTGVGVDRHDRVYVFCRDKHPLIIFDREGNFINSWGEGVFSRPHAVTMGPDDTIYLTDGGNHSIRKCTLEGKILHTFGVPGNPAPFRGGQPFNKPTDVAVAKDGSVFISDGYGNTRIHKYSTDGKYLFSWGEPGTDPGQFHIPHNICIDRNGYVYVADRENHRIQVFDQNGRFETQWHDLFMPAALRIDSRDPAGDRVYVGEMPPSSSLSQGIPNLGARLGIYTLDNRLLARLGAPLPGLEPEQFIAPHAIAVDSYGDVYVGEVSWTMHGSKLEPPREVRSLRKLVRVNH